MAQLSNVAADGYNVNFFSPLMLAFHFLRGYWSNEHTKLSHHMRCTLFFVLLSIERVLKNVKWLKAIGSVCGCAFGKYC